MMITSPDEQDQIELLAPLDASVTVIPPARAHLPVPAAVCTPF